MHRARAHNFWWTVSCETYPRACTARVPSRLAIQRCWRRDGGRRACVRNQRLRGHSVTQAAWSPAGTATALRCQRPTACATTQQQLDSAGQAALMRCGSSRQGPARMQRPTEGVEWRVPSRPAATAWRVAKAGGSRGWRTGRTATSRAAGRRLLSQHTVWTPSKPAAGLKQRQEG